MGPLASRAVRSCALVMLTAMACQRSAEPSEAIVTDQATATATAAAAEATAATMTPAAPVASRADAQRLNTVFEAALEPVVELSYEQLHGQHTPAYLPAHGLAVRDAAHYQEFVDAFDLDATQRERLETLGFVVLADPDPRPGGSGPVDFYYRVFAADLPVFVSADSILHAWHRSYDVILERTETDVLAPLLRKTLENTLARLDPADPAQRDATLYVAVALGLLRGDSSAPAQRGPGLHAELKPIFAAIKAQRPTSIDLLGSTIDMDFSQFIPRGHYTHSEALEHYFQAMMWLGRAELRLYDRKEQAVSHPREEAAARALVATMGGDEHAEGLKTIEDFYRLHVGQPNAVGASELLELCDRAKLPGCEGEGTARLHEGYRAQGSAAYRGRDARALPPVVAMRMFPQRFAYDAWVTTQTTAPRLPPNDPVGGRFMASPLDVAFVLGSDRALEHLEHEMVEGPLGKTLPGRLAAIRQTLQTIPPTELDETIYNHWLQALMAVAKTDLDSRLPRVMRTAAWHDHRLETMLASWAELRHDTILVVDQSEGSFGCQYPKGYVEPLPDLYHEVDEAIAHLVALYEGPTLVDDPSRDSIVAWAAHARTVMQRLGRLSEQELNGEPMSAEDLAFLNRTVDKHKEGYQGVRSYDGWYPALYWRWGWTLEPGNTSRGLPFVTGAISEPIISDVHTDKQHGRALEVGTGHPELMLVVVDQGEDVAVYGGPVSSFYAFERPVAERMTDNEWQTAVEARALPSRPEFARSYHVESHAADSER